MATIERPCYVTREEVMRAMDVKQAAYNRTQVDRNIVLGSESAEQLCRRKFYVEDTTRKFDWPNYQYAYPWRLWLDQHEIAVSPLTSLTSGGVTIASNQYFLRPINSGPPFTWIELDRSLNAAFGNGPTPQLEIVCTGTFGYWNRQYTATTLAADVTTTTATKITVAKGTGDDYGVGDLIFLDNERMLVQGASYIDTGVSPSSGGSSNAGDKVIGVPDGTKFFPGEIILWDSEWMLINDVVGNNLFVKRAFDGSVLAAHSGGTLFARRSLTVARGQLGTTAATHTSGANVNVMLIPGLVKEYSLAQALIGLTQEPAAYAGSVGQTGWSAAAGGRQQGQRAEPIPGPGIPDLQERCYLAFGRKVRSRAI